MLTRCVIRRLYFALSWQGFWKESPIVDLIGIFNNPLNSDKWRSFQGFKVTKNSISVFIIMRILKGFKFRITFIKTILPFF